MNDDVDRLWMRRIVHFVVFWQTIDKTIERVIARAARRRPPYTEEQIRWAWPHAQQAILNAKLCSKGNCPDSTVKLKDVPGIVLRGTPIKDNSDGP